MRTSTSAEDPVVATPHVLVLPKWWPGPADPQLGDFIRKQTQATGAFVRVTVLLIRPSDQAGTTATISEHEGLTEVLSTYTASTSALRPARKIVNLWRYWAAAKVGWQCVRTERGTPQLVHVHILVRPALFASWIRRKHGIPFLISEQSSEYLDGTYIGKGPLFHAINQHLFRRASRITVVSDRLGEGLKRLGLCTTYGVVPNVVPGMDRTLPPAGEAGHFLVVADLVDRTKNVSGVIRALKVARLQETSLHLTVIGDGPDRNELETLVRTLGLEHQVKFLGRLPNASVLDHMARTGAVIINSNVETFSVVTGEALAQGKPVIATRCGGPENFITSTNGVLIPLNDVDALSDAMLHLYRSHHTYLPADIRKSLAARFSPAAVGAAFAEVYESCLNAPHA